MWPTGTIYTENHIKRDSEKEKVIKEKPKFSIRCMNKDYNLKRNSKSINLHKSK